ncbi:Protein of unknown function [Thalassobacillus cyri]|uniref:4 TMS phage holin, superfamily IV n=1 Tax=Thalassobacillus cyri TaxID=571932 RepID=A0A1H4HGU8_9BACI|nr:DUF2512 family protein [Thalassobacillus cyri]SEB21033.1 Protein of unknown function [Thalassobacillus cyri]
MEHVKALAIKGLMTFVALFVVLTLGFNISVLTVLAITIVLGAVSYPLGDLKLYPKTTNMIATTADIGIAFLVIAVIGPMFGSNDVSSWMSAGLLAGIVVAAGEFFFHNYIGNKPIGDNKRFRTSYHH